MKPRAYLIWGMAFLMLTMVSAEISSEQALSEIKNAELIVSEMLENNLPIRFVNNTLNEAKVVFQQAKYADILRHVDSLYNLQQDAKAYFTTLNWTNITYASVLNYTSLVKDWRDRAFGISDSLAAVSVKIEALESKGASVSELKTLKNLAETEFYAEKFNESEQKISELNRKISETRAHLGIVNKIKLGVIDFFTQNWIYLIILIVIALIVLGIILMIVRKNISAKRMERMKIEKIVLSSLIKKTRSEKFGKTKFLALAHNTKMKHLKEKLEDINKELPLLEKKFGKK